MFFKAAYVVLVVLPCGLQDSCMLDDEKGHIIYTNDLKCDMR